MLLLENMGTSLLVGSRQLPSLHGLLLEAAEILGMEAPDLYVRQVRRNSPSRQAGSFEFRASLRGCAAAPGPTAPACTDG